MSLPIPLRDSYFSLRHEELINLIDKPQWSGFDANGDSYIKTAQDTLIPDIISICDNKFIIFDAKYYNLQMEADKDLRGQPGIESITKQYLYQLAYQDFICVHQFEAVRNCFLMPTDKDEVIIKGEATLSMLSKRD